MSADRLLPAGACAGCRVDLAGGTLDIWPIGLLHAGASTVNVAIETAVEAWVEPRARGFAVRVGGHSFEAETWETLVDRPDTRLAARIALAYGLPPAGLRLSSASPRGAGLGASSALAVALVRAIERSLGREPSTPDACAALVRDLEAAMMALPTGIQDQYPPLLGGVLVLRYCPGGAEVTRLDVDLEALGARLVVTFSGQSHISGDTNWQIVRRRLDGESRVCQALDGIAAAAAAMPDALVRSDWPAVGRLMSEDWRHRLTLAPEVSTPALERLLRAAAEAGAWGGKVCGAGGGGSVAVLAAPERRGAVLRAMAAAGGVPVEASPRSAGVQSVNR